MWLVGPRSRHDVYSGGLHIVAPWKALWGFALRSAGYAFIGPYPPQAAQVILHAPHVVLHPDPLLLEHRYLLGDVLLHHRHMLRVLLQLRVLFTFAALKYLKYIVVLCDRQHGPGMRFPHARRNQGYLSTNLPAFDALHFAKRGPLLRFELDFRPTTPALATVRLMRSLELVPLFLRVGVPATHC